MNVLKRFPLSLSTITNLKRASGLLSDFADLHSKRFAYRERVSLETVLHAFVSRVETHLDRGNYEEAVLMVFQGAFRHIIYPLKTSANKRSQVGEFQGQLLTG